MKNLFKRVYLKHDNNVTPSGGQTRIIVTDREMEFPISTDPAILASVQIHNYCQNLEELDELYGGREGLWGSLMARDEKLLIIGSPSVVAELLIQYWKSIFKDTTPDFLWGLYQCFIQFENGLSYREKPRANSLNDANVHCSQCSGVGRSLFGRIYERTGNAGILHSLQKSDLPIEYLLAGNLAGVNNASVNTVTFRKIRNIVSINIVRQLVNTKEEFFVDTHNFYLLDPSADPKEVMANPLEFMAKHPDLNWALDPEFVYGNEDAILRKYSMNDFIRFFQTYTKLFRYVSDHEKAAEYLSKNDYQGLLAYDIADEKGNFFGSDSFMIKVNGLLISHLYQLKREGNLAELAKYELQ